MVRSCLSSQYVRAGLGLRFSTTWLFPSDSTGIFSTTSDVVALGEGDGDDGVDDDETGEMMGSSGSKATAPATIDVSKTMCKRDLR